MSMTLESASQAAIPAKTFKRGKGQYTNPAGESLKIEINGVDILDVDTPAGKSWEVNISVDIVETDV